ncbi:hypothetical protein, partial [Acetobacter syzygii]|uniref:hypothetical protein n=1 Tax=Acetobacter syzygii TaxID=146476 RepID=UPI001C532314
DGGPAPAASPHSAQMPMCLKGGIKQEIQKWFLKRICFFSCVWTARKARPGRDFAWDETYMRIIIKNTNMGMGGKINMF